MHKINTARKLLATIASLVLVFLTVITYSQASNMTFVGGSAFATNYVKPSLEWLTQWSSIIIGGIIICLIGYAIVNYFMNRRKPDKPSDEAQAITNLAKQLSDRDKVLIEEIKGLRQDLKNGGVKHT